MVIFHSYVNVYQRVSISWKWVEYLTAISLKKYIHHLTPILQYLSPQWKSASWVSSIKSQKSQPIKSYEWGRETPFFPAIKCRCGRRRDSFWKWLGETVGGFKLFMWWWQRQYHHAPWQIHAAKGNLMYLEMEVFPNGRQKIYLHMEMEMAIGIISNLFSIILINPSFNDLTHSKNGHKQCGTLWNMRLESAGWKWDRQTALA